MSRQKAVAVFIVLAFAYFLSTLIRAITATLAPTLVEEMALSSADLGLLAGGYFLGFAATQIPLGTWLDRHGPKKVELTFLCIAVVGCLAFSVAENFSSLLAARILCGVGVSACLMAPLTGYRRWLEPANQMRANSWMLMVGALGMVASTLPVQWLLPVVGWRALFVMLAIAVAVSMVVIAMQVPAWQARPANAPSEQAQESAPGYAEVWRSPYFRRMAPLGFVCYGGMVAMQTLWAAPWMVKVAGYTPQQAAAGLFWINIAMLFTFTLWGTVNPWLTRKGYTADRMLAWGMPLCIAIVAAIAAAGPAIAGASALAWALFCVVSTLGSQAQPAVGMSFRPELAGRALSAYNLVIFCGVFCMQWGVGLSIDVLRKLGWSEIGAHQGALGLYALCSAAAYAYFMGAKRS